MSMANLENVKVGDKLIVSSRYDKYIATVERLTATLVITKHIRFSKKDGKMPGCDSWNFTTAEPATPEMIEQIRKKEKRIKLIQSCEKIEFRSLTDSKLEAILKIANKE